LRPGQRTPDGLELVLPVELEDAALVEHAVVLRTGGVERDLHELLEHVRRGAHRSGRLRVNASPAKHVVKDALTVVDGSCGHHSPSLPC